MKDFNFFSPYIIEKRNKRLKKIYIIAVSSLLTIGLLSFTAMNLYQIMKYKSEISKVESYLNSDKTKELLVKYEVVKKNNQLLKDYYNKATEIDKAVVSHNTVSTELLKDLTSVMPQDSKLISLTVSNRDVEINYFIVGLVSVAEIEHNLKALDKFDVVHVNVVNAETKQTAMISCRLKDVNN